MNARIQLSSLRERSAVVAPYGFPMHCTFEYDAGEPPIISAAGMFDHPGSPSNVALLTCRIGGVEVMDMLKNEQQERIEEAILDQLEGD